MERRFVRFEIKRVVEYDQEDGSGHYYKMVEEGQEPDDGLLLWGLYGYDSAGELQWLTDSQSRQWLEGLKEYMEGLVATQEAAESAARSILEFVEGGRKSPEDWHAVVDSLRHASRMGEPGAKPCDIQCLGGSYPSDNTGVMRFLAKFSESGWKEGNATISYEVTPDKKVYRIGVEFRPDKKG